MNPTDSDCVCGGLGWLIVDIDGDASRAWVQRCDACQYFTEDDPRNLYDQDAAEVASGATGYKVGRAHPNAGGHECDHAHPYLIGYPLDIFAPAPGVATPAGGA